MAPDTLSLPLAIQPFLRREARAEHEADLLTRFVTSRVDLVIGDANQARCLAKMLPLMDGKKTAAEIARALDLDGDEVLGLIEPLYAQGLVADASAVPLPALLFFDHARATANCWAPPESYVISEAAFAGKFTRKLALGVALTSWFVERAQLEHLSLQIARAKTRHMRFAWARLLAQEHEHQLWVTEGLERAFTTGQLLNAHPLPGLVARLNVMRWAAETNELAYAILCALAEGLEERQPNVPDNTSYYYEIIKRHPELEDVVSPLLRHTLYDEQLNHFNFCRLPFEDHPPLTVGQRREIMQHLWDFTQAFAMEAAEVFDFYSREDTPALYVGPHQGTSTGRLHPLPVGEIDGIRRLSHTLVHREHRDRAQSYQPTVSSSP